MGPDGSSRSRNLLRSFGNRGTLPWSDRRTQKGREKAPPGFSAPPGITLANLVADVLLALRLLGCPGIADLGPRYLAP